MVNKIVGWLVLVPLCALLVAFALANRHLVAVNLNPFVGPAPETADGYGIPLFVILYVVLLIGVLLGGIATWFAQGPHRKRERHWRKEARMLQEELETLRRQQAVSPGVPLTEVDDLLDVR
ncbi:LapA family protein [Devosia sp. PTR5]|jgi:hypothetical protein|uniref:LapA family protein n=1 Tax=Devosia oryzisoli TaxID=2774138 RepID=A0A927FU65_9HYPH|nr:LapA family protein [Devosia oryzisoli]MBD8066365.1 LapA family protein [Devosia oryzisoli]